MSLGDSSGASIVLYFQNGVLISPLAGVGRSPLLGTPRLRASLHFLHAIQQFVLWVETFGPGVYIYIYMFVLYLPFKGLYRALIPSFPTKNQPVSGAQVLGATPWLEVVAPAGRALAQLQAGPEGIVSYSIV